MITLQLVLVLGLLIAGVILFARETFSVDVITLLLVLGLMLGGVLSPAEAFSGFSSDILIILASIFVIGGALQETGVLETAGLWLSRLTAGGRHRLLAGVMILPASLSGFMNNTTVTAMFLPPVTALARRAGVSPSQLLLPMAFASILGGTCTLIGTSTNVAVSGYMVKAGMAPMGFFEITPIGVIIVVIGMAYMLTIGAKLLPDRARDVATDDYDLREYLSEIVILPGSPLIGQSTADSDLSVINFRVIRMWRGDASHEADAGLPMAEGDILLVQGKVEDLMKVKKIEGIELSGERSPSLTTPKHARVIEILINPRSELVGQTLRESDFRQRFGAVVLAMYRRGRPMHDFLAAIPIQAGDVLLLQGPDERIEALRHEPSFSVLGEVSETRLEKKFGLIALGAFGIAILAGALGWIPVSTAFLAAALAVVLSGCITIEKAYTIIDWRLLILIGGMTAFGVAMQKSGAAGFLADSIVGLLSPFGIMAVLTGFFVLTILLTQPMSNAAAALVVLPVALEAAGTIGANERTFAIAIMLAASISFITPFEPSCVLVYGPGKYQFRDFVRVGGGLTLVLAVVVLLVLPYFWPLQAVAPTL